LLTGLLIGAAAGAVAGILLAPQSGKETRKRLCEEGERLREELEKYSRDFSEKATEIRKDIETRLGEIKNKLQGVAEEVEIGVSAAKTGANKKKGS